MKAKLKRNKKGFTLQPFNKNIKPKTKYKRKGAGFTLVELLVVVSIIGLLVAMTVINIQNSKQKARDARRVSDINNIATALALYHNDNNRYPFPYAGNLTGSDAVSTALRNAGYISSAPLDPLNQAASGCGIAGGYRYYYSSTDGSNYFLAYCLETNSVLGKVKGENRFIP